MFSIVIPTYNNINYLEICIESILKNSKFNHQIIVHVNGSDIDTINYLNKKNIEYTLSSENLGVCSSVNIAAKKSNYDYILYCHDDMYLCPNWDFVLFNNIEKLNTKLFYLSGTMIEKKHVEKLDIGNDYKNFKETAFLKLYKNIFFKDSQGSHWAPHLIHKDLWNKVGGFSEEFNPGVGSDPDLNMKLWNEGVRIFKGIGEFKVYHFGSIVLRKNTKVVKNKGSRIFLKKWGISIKFFRKFYLRSNQVYDGPLDDPNKDFFYYLNLILCKMQLIYNNILLK